MKCWPEGAAVKVEPFPYPSVPAPPVPSWEAFGGYGLSECGADFNQEPELRTEPPKGPAANEAHADEVRRSFELGRERGVQEAGAAERSASAESMRVRESARMEEAA